MTDDTQKPTAGGAIFNFTDKKHYCPRHGEVKETMDSTIPGHEGRWCLRCWVEMVNRHCHKVTDTPPPSPLKKW